MKTIDEVIEDAERCLLPFPGDCLNCTHYDDAMDPNTCMQKIIAEMLEQLKRTATAPWNPDRNRYCCNQCGAYIGKYDKYCNGCGARLTDWTPDGRGKRK